MNYNNQPNSYSIYKLIKDLSWIDKLLPLIIILTMILGTILSIYVPNSRLIFDSNVKLVGVSIPLALGMIIMMIPPLCKIEWESLYKILTNKKIYTQLLISFVLNWLICPFIMVGLSWMVFHKNGIYNENDEEYRIGIIMIGIARCIAMVIIWNELSYGDNTLCITIVIFNSILQMILYAPYQILLCYKISNYNQSIDNSINLLNLQIKTVFQNVGIFLGIPMGLGILIRLIFIKILNNPQFYNDKFLSIISPLSLIGLIYTILIIFITRGNEFIKNIDDAIKCFIPLILYFIIVWFGTFLTMRFLSNRLNKPNNDEFQEPLLHHCGCEKNNDINNPKSLSLNSWLCSAKYGETITQTFTAASNNFELSLSIAISIYGSGSKQSIAATFGPLLEVPILLILTLVARYSRYKLLWNDEKVKVDG
ncbi:hypothetical protein WICMUC_005053 [Wickerhamomyces mucosus]|uniref:Arsenical-resistance protein n=1 Tax=Wickerhamomyces mucosus TaxID=1378264 RepID=A0A9P8PC37_9ASCO|nr:hypothetical protein WICMUC_005053 [Wickerhamomyces mucosus]